MSRRVAERRNETGTARRVGERSLDDFAAMGSDQEVSVASITSAQMYGRSSRVHA